MNGLRCMSFGPGRLSMEEGRTQLDDQRSAVFAVAPAAGVATLLTRATRISTGPVRNMPDWRYPAVQPRPTAPIDGPTWSCAPVLPPASVPRKAL